MNVRKPPLSEQERNVTIHVQEGRLDEVQGRLKKVLQQIDDELFIGARDEEMVSLREQEAKLRRKEARIIKKLNDLQVRKEFIK